MAKYFIDTEFKEKPNTIDLISIGIVAEDGRELYLLNKEVNLNEIWEDKWLRENVLLTIYREHVHGDLRYHFPFSKNRMNSIFKSFGKSMEQIASEIEEFVYYPYTITRASDMKYLNKENTIKGNPIEFYGYYCDYDWVVFCWIFGRMIDLPDYFPMYCRDLKQTLDEKYPGGVYQVTDETAKRKIEDHPAYPKQKSEHNALEDARWNYKLFKFLQE